MEKKQFILFVSKAAKFLVIFLVVDFALGTAAEYLFLKQSSGKFARITYSLKEANTNVLIFGSSHANRHYVPSVFENKLKLSCYNVGVQGQQILFHTALEEIIVNRIKPKIIILNLDQNWMYESQEAYDRLANLHPYYTDYTSVIKPLLQLKSKFDYVFLNIKSYKLNSTIVHILKYYFQPQLAQKGYNPLNGKMVAPSVLPQETVQPIIKKERIDTNFVSALNRFVSVATKNNIKLVCVVSPKIEGDQQTNESYEMMKTIINKNNIPLFDFSNNKNFNEKYELFNDGSHLNNDGAVLFSGMLSDSISTLLEKGIGNKE